MRQGGCAPFVTEAGGGLMSRGRGIRALPNECPRVGWHVGKVKRDQKHLDGSVEAVAHQDLQMASLRYPVVFGQLDGPHCAEG